MPNNPYIELVKEHKKIFTSEQEIYWKAWKWWLYFGNTNDLVLEIWTWLGNFFSKQVRSNPQKNYVWMEIRYKRLFQTAEKCLWNKASYSENWQHELLDEKNIDNFVLLKEFWEKIWEIFWKEEISETFIFFPDPWARKKSQLKNRLLQKQFLENLYWITKKWWWLIIKTDHRGYFDFLLSELQWTKWKQSYLSYDFESEPEFQNAETTEFQQLFRWQKEKIHHIELHK